jgi:hypothetical protein
MTALLTGVVMVMVVCHTPKVVMNIYECYMVCAAVVTEIVFSSSICSCFVNPKCICYVIRAYE